MRGCRLAVFIKQAIETSLCANSEAYDEEASTVFSDLVIFCTSSIGPDELALIIIIRRLKVKKFNT